jgi:hypothetical protein
MGRRQIGRGIVLAASWLTLLATPDAHADTAECVKSSEDGISARDHGRLREARKDFVTCAADACPKQLRIDCARWLDDVEQSLPTVVFGARGADGSDLFDITVSVDGEKVTGHEQGKAVALDPGPHVVRFERPSSKPATMKILLRAGEHNRPIVAKLLPENAKENGKEDGEKEHHVDILPTGPESGPHIPTPSLVLGAVGLGALGSFTFFAITGAQEKEQLRSSCSPRCTDDQVSPLKTRYVVADVSLGIAIVSLGIATYLWLTDK